MKLTRRTKGSAQVARSRLGVAVRAGVLIPLALVAAASSQGQEWQGWLDPSQNWGTYGGQEVSAASVLPFKSFDVVDGKVYGRALIIPNGVFFGTRAFLIRRIGYSGWNQAEDLVPYWLDYSVIEGGHVGAGYTMLDDDEGTYLMSGGGGIPNSNRGTSLFREDSGWLDLHIGMNKNRYHPTMLWTPDGRAASIGGTGDNDSANGQHEIITPTYGAGWPSLQTLGPWQLFAESDPSFYARYYPNLYVMPDGRYLHAGPYPDTSYSSRLFDPLSLLWSRYGSINGDPNLAVESGYPSSTMFVVQQGQATKAFVVRSGGVRRQEKGPNGEIYLAVRNAQILDITLPTPSWQKLPSGGPPENQGRMNQGRAHHLMISLPNRTVLAINGNEYGKFNELEGGPISEFRKPEIFDLNAWLDDPSTGSWTSYAAPANPNDQIVRGYHSTAWVMPDGRIGVGSGDKASFTDPERTTTQFWSPPYLGIPNRPVIRNFPPGDLRYARSYSLTLDSASRPVKRVSLISLGAQTHGFIQNQRYIELKWNGSTSRFEAPANANLCPPGWYMLFVEDSAGAVSQAKIVRVGDGYSRCTPSYAEVDGAQVDESKLRAGDNGYVQFNTSSGQPGVLIVRATVPAHVPGKVRVRIEHRAQTGSASFTVEIWSFVDNTWVPVVAPASLSTQDRLDRYEFLGSSKYRNSGGEMQMRITYSSPSASSVVVDEVQFGTLPKVPQAL
mgnify:CR=1 FL=1